jgi:hypothetical protein
MLNRLSQSLLSWLLIVLIGLTTAISPSGPKVLCVATGDHQHVSIEQAHGASGYHLESHSHEPAHEDQPLAQADHEHGCLDIMLPSGDLPTQGRKASDSAELSKIDLAPVSPVFSAIAFCIPVKPEPRQSSPPLSVPPDIVRTTVLLI